MLMKDSLAIITDIFAPSTGKSIRQLVSCMAQDAQEAGKQSLRTWSPQRHFLTHTLCKMGFEMNMDPHGIVPAFTLGSESSDAVLSTENFFFTMGDGDLY